MTEPDQSLPDAVEFIPDDELHPSHMVGELASTTSPKGLMVRKRAGRFVFHQPPPDKYILTRWMGCYVLMGLFVMTPVLAQVVLRMIADTNALVGGNTPIRPIGLSVILIALLVIYIMDCIATGWFSQWSPESDHIRLSGPYAGLAALGICFAMSVLHWLEFLFNLGLGVFVDVLYVMGYIAFTGAASLYFLWIGFKTKHCAKALGSNAILNMAQVCTWTMSIGLWAWLLAVMRPWQFLIHPDGRANDPMLFLSFNLIAYGAILFAMVVFSATWLLLSWRSFEVWQAHDVICGRLYNEHETRQRLKLKQKLDIETEDVTDDLLNALAMDDDQLLSVNDMAVSADVYVKEQDIIESLMEKGMSAEEAEAWIQRRRDQVSDD